MQNKKPSISARIRTELKSEDRSILVTLGNKKTTDLYKMLNYLISNKIIDKNGFSEELDYDQLRINANLSNQSTTGNCLGRRLDDGEVENYLKNGTPATVRSLRSFISITVNGVKQDDSKLRASEIRKGSKIKFDGFRLQCVTLSQFYKGKSGKLLVKMVYVQPEPYITYIPQDTSTIELSTSNDLSFLMD
jgi:hypothetical protein